MVSLRYLKQKAQRTQSFEYEPPISPHIEHKMENWRCSDCSECTEIEEARFSNKERTFVVVSCLPNESKLFISFDFVLD